MTGSGWKAALGLGGAAQNLEKKGILGIVLRIALGIVLLFFSLREVDWRLLGQHLAAARLSWLAAALGAILLTTLLKVLRWRSLMHSLAAGKPAGLLRLGGAFVVGQAANILLPFRGGDVARVGWLALEEQEGDRALAGAVTVGLEKYLDVVALAALLLLLWPLLPIQALERSRGWWLPLSILLTALFLLSLWAAPRVWSWMKPRLEGRLPSAWQGRLVRADHWLRSSLRLRTAKGWIPLAGWTVCIWGLMAATNLLVLAALGLPTDARAAGLVLVMIYVGVAPALMPGNAGPFYFFAMLGLAPFGVAEPERIAFAVLLHALVTVPPLALAVVYLAASRWMGRRAR
jgi:hypothetical protein